MKKIKFKYLLTALIPVLAITGCVKLKETPESIIGPATFYKTSADFNAAIDGAIKPMFGSYGAFDFNNAILLCGGGEDVTSRPTAPELKQYDVFKPTVNGFSAHQEWALIYQEINASNNIIANINNATGLSAAEKAGYDGQARYLRAMGYFYLTRWFGEIPVITEANQGNALNVGQSTVALVYAQIISDLQKAESELPAMYADKGRPTKGAASTLLAEAYLTMAGWPLKDASKYALARDEAKKVMDMGVYALEPKYGDLWKWTNRLSSREFIFMFFGSSSLSWMEGSHLHVSGRAGEEGGWDDMMSEARYFNAFPAGPRKDATFHTTLITNAGKMIPWQKSLIGQPYIDKFRDAGPVATPFNAALGTTSIAGYDGDGFFPVSRFADVLLIYAEAANMAEGGPSAAALEALNQVRRRASGNDQDGYPDLAAGTSQQAFDTAVLSEREWEFGFELKRWFDLVRKDMVVSANSAVYPNVTERNQLIPKPQVEVNLIKGLKQNPGY